jgi:hypothetical protein
MNELSADLFSPRPPEFKGETFDPKRDGKRLGAQMQRVVEAVEKMRRYGREWFTLATLADLADSPEASVSARLRDMRRAGYTVERRYVESGLWEYRVVDGNRTQA